MVELISKGEFEKVNAKHATKDHCVANAKEEAKKEEDAGKMGAHDFIGTFCMSYSAMNYCVPCCFLNAVQAPDNSLVVLAW